jgi:hypothetical protein
MTDYNSKFQMFLTNNSFHTEPTDPTKRFQTEIRKDMVWGLNPGGVRFFAPVQTGNGAHPASCKMGTGSFLGVESGRGVMLNPHTLLVPRSKNRVQKYLYSP